MKEEQIGKPLCPEGRLSAPTLQRDGRDVVDVRTYVPHLLAAVSNSLSRGASHIYLERFGVGIAEWRVLSMLAIEPGISANRICEVISQDKSATSRALSRLHEQGRLDFEAPEPDPRKKFWRLNEAGYALHDRILQVALERERQLIRDADPDDLEAFIRVMRIMRRNVDRLASGDAPDEKK